MAKISGKWLTGIADGLILGDLAVLHQRTGDNQLRPTAIMEIPHP